MLKTERYLQMKDLFPVALETKMPRLDDAGMYRSDRDLMHFVPFNPVEIHHGRESARRRHYRSRTPSLRRAAFENEPA